MEIERLSYTRQQAEATQYALDQHSLVSITDLDGAIVYVNEKFSEVSGYSVSEIIGNKHSILNSGLHSKKFWRQMHETVLAGKVWHNKVRNRAKSGKHYWVDTTIVPNIGDSGEVIGFTSIRTDITQQKHNIEQLAIAKKQAEAAKFALDQHSLVSITDLEGDILYVNEKFIEVSGYTEQELLGRKHNVLNSGMHSKAFWSEMHQTVLAGKVWRNEVRNRAKNGEHYWVDTTIVPNFSPAQKVIGFTSIRTDITQQKHSMELLAIAKRQAESGLKAKDDFLANMSHEIRTPMNGIFASLQLLSGANLSPGDRELIESALFSSRNLLTIINDILDFSKVEAGKLKIENIEFSIKNVIESVVSDVLPSTNEKGIQFLQQVKQNVGEYWIGDPVRVKQILLNLISNSVKFTEKGEVCIETGVTQRDEEIIGVHFVVKDTGIGMSQDTVKNIFERFSQADTSTTRKYGGTGLGMAITLSLIELMDGTIKVSSRLGKGTTITVELPLKKVMHEKNRIAEKTVNCPDMTGNTILIADDNPINRVIFNRVLLPSNAQIVEVSNGEDAVEMALLHKPDLTFMDIQMPILDGVSAFKILRDKQFMNPIIAFTANVLERDIENYSQLGFNGCVSKPLDVGKVYEVLTEFKRQNRIGQNTSNCLGENVP